MRVLLTNYQLSTRSGSELYVFDIAKALLGRGHSPVAYAPVLGPLAEDLRNVTVPVVSDLRRIAEPPDIIHGHHNTETINALLRFPNTPAVRVCHGWVDEPPIDFPRIVRIIAVDQTVRDRLVSEWGVAPERIDVLYNFVDLESFPRRPQLPDRPARAIVFGNTLAEHVATITRACRDAGIAADTIGRDSGTETAAPGPQLASADIVFARGRCAIEAMAVGAAVILCGRQGLGPLVTLAEFDRLRAMNFGLRVLQAPVSTDNIAAELRRYDPRDAAAVSDRIRSEASLDDAVDALLDVYEDAMTMWRKETPNREAELASLADYLDARRHVGSPRAAWAALLQAAYFRCRRSPVLRRFVPNPVTALRLGRRLRESAVQEISGPR